MKPIAEAYKDFPILSRTHRGNRIAYLDSGATTQIPVQVMKALETHMGKPQWEPPPRGPCASHGSIRSLRRGT